MDSSTHSKPSTLEQLKLRNTAAQVRFLAAVVERSEAELSEPRLPAAWSVKDVLGHFAWWDHWLVYTLYPDNAGIRGKPATTIQRDWKWQGHAGSTERSCFQL